MQPALSNRCGNSKLVLSNHVGRLSSESPPWCSERNFLAARLILLFSGGPITYAFRLASLVVFLGSGCKQPRQGLAGYFGVASQLTYS